MLVECTWDKTCLQVAFAPLVQLAVVAHRQRQHHTRRDRVHTCLVEVSFHLLNHDVKTRTTLLHVGERVVNAFSSETPDLAFSTSKSALLIINRGGCHV